MVVSHKSYSGKHRDDSLFGLLAMYKSHISYLRVLVSEKEGKIVVHMTDNPAKWQVGQFGAAGGDYHPLRRVELGVATASVKYLSPENILRFHGPALGVRVPVDKIKAVDSLEKDGNYYLIAPLRFRAKVVLGVKKLLSLTPAKKYEIIETNLAKEQE